MLQYCSLNSSNFKHIPRYSTLEPVVYPSLLKILWLVYNTDRNNSTEGFFGVLTQLWSSIIVTYIIVLPYFVTSVKYVEIVMFWHSHMLNLKAVFPGICTVLLGNLITAIAILLAFYF